MVKTLANIRNKAKMFTLATFIQQSAGGSN